MDSIQSAKVKRLNGRQYIPVPEGWEYGVAVVYLVRDRANGDILISISAKHHRRSILPRLIAELCTGWLVFAIIVTLTVLSQKLINFVITVDPEMSFPIKGYHFVAYGFEFLLFILYHFLKAYDFLHPELILPDDSEPSSPGVTWLTFAKSAIADFLKPYSRMFRPRPKQSDITSNVDDPARVTIRMMRTVMTDEQIRATFLSNGFSAELINELLRQSDVVTLRRNAALSNRRGTNEL